MPRKRTRTGYNARAHSEHPGVSIQARHGHIVLRYIVPGKRDSSGQPHRMQEAVKDAEGNFITSREKAKPLAIAKSVELAKEWQRLEKGGRVVNLNAGWEDLIDAHEAHLKAAGKSAETIRDYKAKWHYIRSWGMRPSHPFKLQIADLENLVAHIKSHKFGDHKEQGLSPNSIASVTRHIKALLNFGRKRLACVKLDAESVSMGLNPGKLPQPLPVALSTADLKKILEAARVHDEDFPRSEVFPLLAFYMLTGCRLGEAERLRWKPSKPGAPESWVDFEGDRLLIHARKTGRQRAVLFKDRPALRRLLETLESRVDIGSSPYVFGGPLPLAIRHIRAEPNEKVIGRSLKSAVKAVHDASNCEWRIKDFRSTAATYLCNSALGASALYDVAQQLGHDYSVLVKYYTGHFQLPEKQRTASTFEAVLGIAEVMESWFKAQQKQGARVHKIRR